MSASQKSMLQTNFAKNPYPSKATLCQLATQLGLTEFNVHSWFQRQRQKVANYKHTTLSNGEDFVYVLFF